MSKRILIPILFFFFCQILLGGGLDVNKESLLFNSRSLSRPFRVGENIIMEFTYDSYAYGGKPYEYGVFIVSKISPKHDTPNPLKYFITSIDNGSTQLGNLVFQLDEPGTKYIVSYYRLPYFTDFPIISETYILNVNDVAKILNYYKKPENSKDVEELCQIETYGYRPPPDTNSIFLYIDNYRKILKDVSEKRALHFSWSIGSESTNRAKNIHYSYKLDPIEDWTIYSNENFANYYFLRPGSYTFQVKAKYEVGGKTLESNVASFSIQVKNLIFQVNDTLSVLKGNPIDPAFYSSKHYNKSKALLIGVNEYDGISFPSIPFVKNDVELLSNTLNHDFGFDTLVLVHKTTKNNIETAISKFVNSAEKDDRIILYFSSHGTSIGEAGYIVPSDGKKSNKATSCISFDYLSRVVDTLISVKHVKHLLIIIDACQAGLGLYSKSSNESSLLELAKYPGAHMMTAGLVDQSARADNGSSIFTRYLINGLNGQADYNKDQVITLSELLVYVQNNVSSYVMKHFGISQTPMLGKIKGAGEMIFILKKH